MSENYNQGTGRLCCIEGLWRLITKSDLAWWAIETHLSIEHPPDEMWLYFWN